MATLVRKKTTATSKRRAVGRRATRPRLLIDDVTAILLISPNAKKLSEFYKETLGLPLEEEEHDGMPLHYGYSLGDVHFAIHSADDWPGTRLNPRSPVIGFGTSNLKAILDRLSARGVKVIGPSDHGFANVASFHDPDGNFISLLEYKPEYW